MICNRCGYKIDNDNIKFCPKCGSDINEQMVKNIINQDKKVSILKILLSMVLVLLVVISISYMFLGFNNDYTVKGNWKCCDYTENITLSDNNNYYFNMEYYDDNTFNFYSLDNNRDKFLTKGTYSESEGNKLSDGVKASIFVYLNSEYVEENGKVTTGNTNRYEFSILSDSKYALVINTQKNNVYLCKRI